MKRRLFRLTALLLALVLTACGKSSAPEASESRPPVSVSQNENVELMLWTYPVGGWGNTGSVSSLIAAFHRDHPGIRVSIRALDYETGDAEVEAAIESGETPDLILEGPERLVANWGARGVMADLSDLWEDEAAEQIYHSVEVACHDSQGRYFIYPLCMTTHCMAINRDLFEAAGAWQYVDEETHTWSTDDFIAAVAALRDYGVENVAAVYCGGQGGDQGTRALVNNLYSGSFTTPEHDRYTLDSPENIRALELLAGMDGVNFNPEIVGADEIDAFCQGDLAMCFCWNVFMEVKQVINNPNLDFDIFPMAFPTDDGNFNLQGGIWGFGAFDNGDAARLDAAKTFIRYMTENDAQYTRSVLTSTYWPVRDMPGFYANDDLMTEYSIFQQYLGDFYQVTPGWADARTAWWTMLQQVGEGKDVPQAVKEFDETANAAAGA